MLSNDEILEAIKNLSIQGPTIPLKDIPVVLRDEFMSSRDLSIMQFPDVPGELAVSSKFFAFWIGCRLHPDYEHPEVIRHFSEADIESLHVLKKPLSDEVITANFKAGSYLVDLMKNGRKYASVAFGYLRDQSFELRHSDWICTSLIIGIRKQPEERLIYTKSGSIYRADLPIQHVQLPLDELTRLRRGRSPAKIDGVITVNESD